MTIAYIGLGANLGDAQQTVRHVLHTLDALPHTALLASSSLYRTAPVDAQGADYINAVAKIQTILSPHELLKALQAIEQNNGRVRPYKNAPRTLDLDILLYGDERIDDPDLTIPHAHMHERAFVLVPLAELHPGLRLPQGCLNDLITLCADQRVSPAQ